MAETHHNIAISLRDLGDHVSALRATDEAVRIAGGVGDEALAALTLAGRAELHLLLSDVDLAAAELDRAGSAAEHVQDHAGLAEVWRLQAGIARARGRDHEAAALLGRAAALGREHGNANTLADIERDLGAVLAARGDAAGARAARERAIALFQRLGAKKAASELAALIA
jgi:tetratricopeptide (TPR) repeat protein